MVLRLRQPALVRLALLSSVSRASSSSVGPSPQVAAAAATNPLKPTFEAPDLPRTIGKATVTAADLARAPKYRGRPRDPIVRLDREDGIGGLREKSQVMRDGQLLGFVKTDAEKGKIAPSGPLPCDRTEDVQQATANIDAGAAPFATKARSSPLAPKVVPKAVTRESVNKGSNAKIELSKPRAGPSTNSHGHGHSHSHGDGCTTCSDHKAPEPPGKEAEDYYKNIPVDMPDRNVIWERINKAGLDKERQANMSQSPLDPAEVDFLRIEEDLKKADIFHYRIGELAFPDVAMRRDFFAMHTLNMSLNKARWTMLEVQAEKGQKSTGAGMKLMFWKDATSQIIEGRTMPTGQFVDSHPVLRPFAYSVRRHDLTKAFLRGFVDAKLRVTHQPGNVKQLFEVFDKSYGYFYNTLLEMMGIKDDGAEHALQHIGRAVGLTQHCVMFWKKYARLGVTMLPADICADNHVNISLLKNLHLAEKDRYVRRALYDVMCVVKTEMLHAQDIISTCPPEAWPLLTDSFYPNYYLGFLQRNNFNVSAYWADDNIESAGFGWYKWKKMAQWERSHDLAELVAEVAPIPYMGFSPLQRESKYKRTTDMTTPRGGDPGNLPQGDERARSRY